MINSKIIKNAAQCRLCGDIIVYDNPERMETCKCGEISVSGGFNFIARWASTTWNNIIDLSEYEDSE